MSDFHTSLSSSEADMRSSSPGVYESSLLLLGGRSRAELGYTSDSIRGGFSVLKYVISGASPVAVARYVAQQVFINSRARSISSSCRRLQLDDCLALDSNWPCVAPRAIVPGMKHTRWSILGSRAWSRPSGLSARTASFPFLVYVIKCLLIPVSASSHISL